MGTNVLITPQLLRWAMARSGKEFDVLVNAVPQIPKWIAGTAMPTYPQLEHFARSTYVPLGSLFLTEPPEENLLVTDFRVVDGGSSSEPSPSLIDTIDICLARQDWYRDYRQAIDADSLDLVGSLDINKPPRDAARLMLADIGIGSYAALNLASLDEIFRALSERIEQIGIMVMVNGIVGLNTHRKLDYREFRGFALSDPFAPLIFINGTDTRAAKIFTLVHELAHIYLGDRGVSAVRPRSTNEHSHERWCNAVAVEFLVPESSFRSAFVGIGRTHAGLITELERLARIFKVSTLVILLRINELGLAEFRNFDSTYELEKRRVADLREENVSTSPGGNFYNTHGVRTGRRFARDLIGDTLGGRTLHRDAFKLLGIKSNATFEKFGQKVGVI